MLGLLFILNLLLWFIVSCFQVYLGLKNGKIQRCISLFLFLIGVIGIITPLNTLLYVNISLVLQLLSIILLSHIEKRKN